MGHQVDWSDVDEVLELLNGIEGIRSADVEVAKVKTPGVWLQIGGYTFDRHAGHTINARLVLLVGDKNPLRAAKALVDLLNLVLTKVTPSGPVTARTVVTPEAPGGLPGLVVPLDVLTVPS